MSNKELTYDQLTRFLSYDAETGLFAWKERKQGVRSIGSTGSKNALDSDGKFVEVTE